MIRVEQFGEVTFLRTTRSVLGWPLFWGGAYLVDGLLVDCGPPATARQLVQTLRGHRVEGLVVTHHHEDHHGAAAWLRKERGIVPRVPAPALPLLADGFIVETYRRLVWGKPPRIVAEPLGSEVQTRTLRLAVVPTPGHSADHVCFFEPERGWLFTGDLFLAERLRYLRDDEDLRALIDSLHTVARLPVKQVFCAHRGLVRDGPAALRRKAENLEALWARARDLLARGVDEAEIARRVVGPEGFLTWFSLGRFSARNFVRAVARDDRMTR